MESCRAPSHTGSGLTCPNAKEASRAPFAVKADLFDSALPQTLGLDVAESTETFSVFVAQDGGNKYNHGAVLMPFGGKLYIQWQSSGLDEDADDTQVVYSQSENGKAWSAPTVLAAARDNGVVTSGGWWTNGELLVAYINVWPKSLQPRGGYVEAITSRNGQDWTQPQRLKRDSGAFVEGVIEQDLRRLKGGRILTAVHEQPGLIATPYYTDDPRGLAGWRSGEMQHLPYADDVSRELEPSWFAKQDDSIVMVFRDQASSFRVLASMSRDNAETWSMPVKTAMPDSRAKQSAGNLPDGTSFLINNPSGSKTRIPLTITLSACGNSFDRAFLLRAGGTDLPAQKYEGLYKRAGYSYPKSIVWNDFLFVSYAVNKEDITVTRVPVSSLVQSASDTKEGDAAAGVRSTRRPAV